MKKRIVIKRNELPTNIPLFQTITLYLLMDKLNAPVWVWSVVATLWSMLIIATIITKYYEVPISFLEITDKCLKKCMDLSDILKEIQGL